MKINSVQIHQLLLFACLFIYAELTCLPLKYVNKIFQNKKQDKLKSNPVNLELNKNQVKFDSLEKYKAKLDSLESLKYALENWETDGSFAEFQHCTNLLLLPNNIMFLRLDWMKDKTKEKARVALNELVERNSCDLPQLTEDIRLMLKEMEGTCQKLKKRKSPPVCVWVSEKKKATVEKRRKHKISRDLGTIEEEDEGN